MTGNAGIWAKEATTLTAVTGTGSGGLVAAGGSVAIAILNGTTQVIINGSVSANGTVTVQAENTINGTSFRAKSGSAGVIGLGAAVAYMDVTGTTQILIGGTGSLSGKSGVNGNAVLTINVSPEADGYGAGWASAGMAASRLKVTGKTLITANAGSKLASANGDVSLNAIQNITSKAVTTAAGGGYVGTGAAALAFVDIESETTINSAASVEAAKGTYGLLAQQILNAEVESKGLSVAFGGAIGAAVARMTVKPTVKAAISGGTIVAKNLAVKALFNVNNNSTYTKTGKITANALAGTGGGAVAASGAKAEITVDGSAAAAVENATVTLLSLIHI